MTGLKLVKTDSEVRKVTFEDTYIRDGKLVPRKLDLSLSSMERCLKEEELAGVYEDIALVRRLIGAVLTERLPSWSTLGDHLYQLLQFRSNDYRKRCLDIGIEPNEKNCWTEKRWKLFERIVTEAQS